LPRRYAVHAASQTGPRNGQPSEPPTYFPPSRGLLLFAAGERLRGSRNRLSEAVICALLRDFDKHGEKAIAEVRRTQPGVYLKVLALLVPKEHRVEHSNPLSGLSDEMLAKWLLILRSASRAVLTRLS
jgi:hypothetical protein